MLFLINKLCMSDKESKPVDEKNKNTDKEKKPSIFCLWVKNVFTWIIRFFLNYVWIGIVLLLISIVLEIENPTTTRHYLINITILVFNYVGIAIIISAIFSFASGTSAFIDQIRGLLESIVIKRNFLNNIDSASKKDVLKTLIQPSIAETNNYPNIGNFYGFFIDKALDINKKNVRSNYTVMSRAYFDKTKNKIAIEGKYSYRLYPSVDGYGDITIGLDEAMPDNKCTFLSISSPTGHMQTFKEEDFKYEKNVKEGKPTRECKIVINDYENMKNCNHLDVDLNVQEYGEDHWILLTFKALQPTDGFRFYLRCDDDLFIKDYSVFVVGAKYDVQHNLSNSNKEITITCNQWINEGSGLSLVVGGSHLT